jgi:adenylate cyclase
MPGRAAVVIAVVLTLLFSALTVFNPSVIDGYLESLLVDYRFKVRNALREPRPPASLRIVAIDEKSLAEYGRWPWDRKLQASLLERILAGRPLAVGLDVFYAEPESAETDGALGAVLARERDRLAAALAFDVEKGRSFRGEIPEALYDSAIPRVENLRYVWPVDAWRVLLPPEPLSGATLFGHVYSLSDRDGRLRWETLYLRYGEEFFPSLALQVARIALGVPLEQMRIVGGVGVRVGGRLLPADDFGRIQINYYGRERSLPYVSAADVLAGRVPPEVFEEAIVFVGTSAIATYDQKATPFSANLPGVEKNATVVANILQGVIIRKAPLLVELLVVLMVGGFLFLAAPRRRALATVGVLLVAVVGFSLVNVGLFTFGRIRLNLFYPLSMLLAGGGLIVSYRYFHEERRAREVRRMFSSYVTERVVNELIRNPEMTKLGGERREVTVLFSDIRGFTSYSESHPPEEVVAMLNEFLQAMTEVIFRWEGTLDKFVGDEIVAFWGAPLVQANHAELAVRCGLNMLARLGELQAGWRARGQVPLDIGIGINSGEVIVGNIGAEGKKMEYTVIGDQVNLGARVEGLTRRYDAHLLTTEYTVACLKPLLLSGGLGHCSVTGLGKVIVKGRDRPVGLFEIRCLEPGSGSSLTECGDEGVARLDEK